MQEGRVSYFCKSNEIQAIDVHLLQLIHSEIFKGASRVNMDSKSCVNEGTIVLLLK